MTPPARSRARARLVASARLVFVGFVAAAGGCTNEPASVPDDARVDAAADASLDAALDLGADASVDAGVDAAADAGVDSGAALCVAGSVAGTCMATSSCTGPNVSVPGFCPGPSTVRCCVPVAYVACTRADVPLVNAGLTTEPAGLGGCPAGMALVGSFCMDRWEATLVALDANGAPSDVSPYASPGTQRVRALSVPGAVPQGYVSEVQAAAACAEAGKRLCTSAEFLRACRGAALDRLFPYGSTREWDRCNDRRSPHPVVQYFGTNDAWIWSMLDHPCFSQLPDSLARTGEHAGCVTPEGIFDLVGNLHEWIDDPAGTFRGGFYVDTAINGTGCTYATTAHDVSHRDYSTGFRCCADAP